MRRTRHCWHSNMRWDNVEHFFALRAAIILPFLVRLIYIEGKKRRLTLLWKRACFPEVIFWLEISFWTNGFWTRRSGCLSRNSSWKNAVKLKSVEFIIMKLYSFCAPTESKNFESIWKRFHFAKKKFFFSHYFVKNCDGLFISKSLFSPKLSGLFGYKEPKDATKRLTLLEKTFVPPYLKKFFD